MAGKWREWDIFRVKATFFKANSEATSRKASVFSSFKMETDILESIGMINSKAKASTFGLMDLPIWVILKIAIEMDSANGFPRNSFKRSM